MNIFVLDENPRLAAQYHLDLHVLKMILEYAQILSTAHRVLDGTPKTITYVDDAGKRKAKTVLLLPGESAEVLRVQETPESNVTFKLKIKNRRCYNKTHEHHPCAVWARRTDANYSWLYKLFIETGHEYSHRYRKSHKTIQELQEFLASPPKKILVGELTPFALAMGDEFKDSNVVQAYRNYYLGPKTSFATWTNREAPIWFKTATKDFHVSNFERTSSVG